MNDTGEYVSVGRFAGRRIHDSNFGERFRVSSLLRQVPKDDHAVGGGRNRSIVVLYHLNCDEGRFVHALRNKQFLRLAPNLPQTDLVVAAASKQSLT